MADLPKPRAAHSPIEPRPSIPDGVWVKCVACREILFARELARNGKVCPSCGHHDSIDAKERLDYLMDSGSFRHIGRPGRVLGGVGRIDDTLAAVAAIDGNATDDAHAESFLDGLARVAALAVHEQLPLLLSVAAGTGTAHADDVPAARARLQAQVHLLAGHRLPYILVLTDPTPKWGYGVALPLGDVVIAEAPASERTAAATTDDLPGEPTFVDMFVPRTQLAQELAKLLAFFAQPRTGDGERTP